MDDKQTLDLLLTLAAKQIRNSGVLAPEFLSKLRRYSLSLSHKDKDELLEKFFRNLAQRN